MAATSARIPIHPGAIDYYERDQHGFIERYGDTLYLLGALAEQLRQALAVQLLVVEDVDPLHLQLFVGEVGGERPLQVVGGADPAEVEAPGLERLVLLGLVRGDALDLLGEVLGLGLELLPYARHIDECAKRS